ncbi:O-antigen ligase [Dinghuibacter silviterrae]|uniref:O-antigen ligase n=2 Tax=Dinghuibacter silviterrae TaxID=1539049 RepID=A0A4R8DWR3_9BACT|nr:O-antigen ligase [Dinghuibacter silviterrae]
MDAAPLVMDTTVAALCLYSAWIAGRGGEARREAQAGRGDAAGGSLPDGAGWSTRVWAARIWEGKILLLWVALFAWTVLSAALSKNQPEGWSYVVLRLPLMAFPLSVGALRLREQLRDRILLSYALVVTAGCLACLVYAWLQYRHTGYTAYLYDDSLTELSSVQSVYVALMVEIALFAMGYLRTKKYSRWLLACMAFLLVFQFMLASRIGLILLYTIALGVALWYYGFQKRRWGRVIAIAACMGVIGLSCVFFFPKTINRFHELAYTGYQYQSNGVESHYDMPVTADQWNGANIRLAVWRCTWDVCRTHLWTGVPVGDKREALVQRYKEVGFDFAVRSRRNTHDTYLDVLLTYGVPGLAVFLLGFVAGPLWKLGRGAARRDKEGRDGTGRNILGLIVVILFTVSMITETYIDRSVGCVLLGFFYAFVLSDYPAYTNPRPSMYPQSTPGSRDA